MKKATAEQTFQRMDPSERTHFDRWLLGGSPELYTEWFRSMLITSIQVGCKGVVSDRYLGSGCPHTCIHCQDHPIAWCWSPCARVMMCRKCIPSRSAVEQTGPKKETRPMVRVWGLWVSGTMLDFTTDCVKPWVVGPKRQSRSKISCEKSQDNFDLKKTGGTSNFILTV